MTIKTVDLLGMVSLVLSAISVVYMLVLEKAEWVTWTLLLVSVALGVMVLLTMVPRKSHMAFLEICREKPRFLPARVVLSVLLFVSAWYLSGAMEQVYGAEHPGVVGNAYLALCPLFSMFGHVIHLGCVKKAKNCKNNEPISTKLGKMHKKL